MHCTLKSVALPKKYCHNRSCFSTLIRNVNKTHISSYEPCYMQFNRQQGPQGPQKISSLKSIKIQNLAPKNMGMCHETIRMLPHNR